IAGRDGIAALEAATGARLWRVLAPGLGEFHLVGDRLAVVQNERRLLCLDGLSGRVLWQRWAQGASCDMPAPRGRVAGVWPVGDDRLVVQVSARRWLLEGSEGRILEESRTSLPRWRRDPVVIGSDHVALVEPDRVQLLDARNGATAWTYAIPGKTI